MGTDIFYMFVIKYKKNFLIKPIRSLYFMAAYYIKNDMKWFVTVMKWMD